MAVDHALAATRWGVAANDSDLQAVKGERLPTLSLDGSYTVRDQEQAFIHQSTPGLPVGKLVLPSFQREFFAFQAQARMPLYTAGRIRGQIDSARSNLEQAEWSSEAARMDLKLVVAVEYVSVLRAQSDLELARTRAASLASHTARVASLFRNQRVPKNDLLASEVALSNARFEEVQAIDKLDMARATYNRRLGRPLHALVRLSPPTCESKDQDLQHLTGMALQQRPELRLLAARAETLRLQAKAKRAERYPQAELRGSYGYLENRFQTPQGLAGIGVGVTWDLYNGGRVRHRANALEQRANQVDRLLEDRRTRIQLEVRQAWLDLKRAKRRVVIADKALFSAEENLRVAKDRYRQGRGTNTEVLDAEALRAENRGKLDQARFDATIGEYRLRRAVAVL